MATSALATSANRIIVRMIYSVVSSPAWSFSKRRNTIPSFFVAWSASRVVLSSPGLWTTDHATIELPDYPTTRLPDYPTTRRTAY